MRMAKMKHVATINDILMEDNKTISNANLKDTVPKQVILCLARARTYVRLRDLNRKITFEYCRGKLGKKMSKFINSKK